MVVKRVTRKRLVKKVRKTQRGGSKYGFSGPKTSFFNSAQSLGTNSNTEDFYAKSRPAYAASVAAFGATIPQGDYRARANTTPLSPAEETTFWKNREAAAALQARQAPTAVQAISNRLKQTPTNSPAYKVLSKMYANSKATAGERNHEQTHVDPKLRANTAEAHLQTLKQLHNAHTQLTAIKQASATEKASMSRGRRLVASIGSVFRPQNQETKALQKEVNTHAKTLRQAKYNVSGYSGKAAKPAKA